MARKAPLEPEWPVEHACKECGARVYIVGSQDGDEVTIDVDALEIRPPDECSPKPVRRIARHPSLRHFGGYRLNEPELFTGWRPVGDNGTPLTGTEPEPEWMWFATRMTLADAIYSDEPLYSEHVHTCRAVPMAALVPKLTNVAFCGDASGDAAGKAFGSRLARARKLPLKERRRELKRLEVERELIQLQRDGQRELVHERLLSEFQATSTRRLATVRVLEADRSDSQELLPF